METTALRQLLKSLCTNFPWNYAVLWKLTHDPQMILSWEDGYCDYPKPRQPVGTMSEEICFTGASDFLSSHCETSVYDNCSGGYSIGLVVANMYHLQYTLGEGVVGKVANTGNYIWVIYDNVSTSKVNSKLVPECPQEWLIQLASGIKTILLVPILPHGVIQLGSLEVVAEDPAVAAYIKDRFTTVPFTLNMDIETQSSSALISALMESLDGPSASTFSPLKSGDSDTVDSVKPREIMLSTSDQVVSLQTFQDALHVSGKDLSGTIKSECENEITVSAVGLSDVSNSLSHTIDASKLEMMESMTFGLSCLEEELQAYSQLNKYNAEVLGEFYSGALNSYYFGDSVDQPFGDEISNYTGQGSSASLLNFPNYCELHKALGPATQRRTNEYLWDSSIPVDNTCSSSSLFRDLTDGIGSTLFAKGGDSEYPLEAVIGNVYCGSDDTSTIWNIVKSSFTPSGQFVTFSQPQNQDQNQNQSEASALMADDSVPRSHVTSACASRGRDEFTSTSSSFKSMMGTFIEKEELEEGYSFMQPRKGPRSSNASKRRAKVGDNQRTRPRDRQLIQDRLKELRELVPNGLKYSIDALLARTIEHMQHLRSVTDQAEKLGEWVHHEVAARKDLRTSESIDSIQNGKTWAFEFGNEFPVCPIVVEDLSRSGHILIEMLCNEHGLFLEIAQVIRSLELTILKGAMEIRSNNTWAHFIVEASKDFHRVDIFWPLMHLLQRKRNPISSKI